MFYCQGALKTSFGQEIMKRCALRTIAKAIIWAKSQKKGDFRKMPVHTSVRIFKYGRVGHTALKVHSSPHLPMVACGKIIESGECEGYVDVMFFQKSKS